MYFNLSALLHITAWGYHLPYGENTRFYMCFQRKGLRGWPLCRREWDYWSKAVHFGPAHSEYIQQEHGPLAAPLNVNYLVDDIG